MKKRILFLTNNDIAIGLYNWLVQEGEDVVLFSERLTEENIKTINPELVISYNYKYIISQQIIDYTNNNLVNLHISFLPWNKGANPNYWSFVDNTPKGVTIHKISKGLDEGDIIVQKELFFDESKESFYTSYQKLHEEIVVLFKENWAAIKEGAYSQKKQPLGGSYHSIKDFEIFTMGYSVDWNENIASYRKKLER